MISPDLLSIYPFVTREWMYERYNNGFLFEHISTLSTEYQTIDKRGLLGIVSSVYINIINI